MEKTQRVGRPGVAGRLCSSASSALVRRAEPDDWRTERAGCVVDHMCGNKGVHTVLVGGVCTGRWYVAGVRCVIGHGQRVSEYNLQTRRRWRHGPW